MSEVDQVHVGDPSKSLEDSPVTIEHPFRFGVVAAQARSGEEWAGKARRIESMGYSTLVMPDGLRHTLAPLPALAAAAAVTRSLRLGTYVIANDFRNPVLLAKEAATLDVLSGGRFELGLGVGRPAAAADNRMLGVPFDSGGVRVDRLAESLALIKPLLAGERATAKGRHYAAVDAEIAPRPVQQPRPPILVAGWGRRLLALAGREADIIALGAPPNASEPAVAERVDWIREAAGPRFSKIELNINLMAVGEQVPAYVSKQMGLTARDLLEAGAVSALVGTTDQMCETLVRRRETLGISYVVVGEEMMETLSPIVERLSGG
jgi:probable F420-dependent oxidoreductase